MSAAAWLIVVTLNTAAPAGQQGLQTTVLHREVTSAPTHLACRDRAAVVRAEQIARHDALIRSKGGRVDAECKPLEQAK